MDVTKVQLLYGEITEKIIGCAFEVHNTLGKGLNEKTYENALLLKFRKLGLAAEQQKALPVFFESQKVGDQVVDILVDNKIIIELKNSDHLQKSHLSQLLGYLKNTQYQLGILLNFGRKVEFRSLIHTSRNKT